MPVLGVVMAVGFVVSIFKRSHKFMRQRWRFAQTDRRYGGLCHRRAVDD